MTAFSTASAPLLNSIDLGRPAVREQRDQLLAQRHVGLVGRDVDAGVEQLRRLLLDRLHDRGCAVADVHHADAAREIDPFLTVGIDETRALGRTTVVSPANMPTPRGTACLRRSISSLFALTLSSSSFGESPRDVLDLQVLVHHVLAAFAAESRMLHSAEGRLRGRWRPVVCADDAVLQAFGHTH